MNISIHLATSIIVTIVLWPFLSWYSLWIIVGGFLIDVDHYLYAGFKWKMWNLKESYHYQKEKLKQEAKKNGEILHIFHTIEFWIFMIVMAYLSYQKEWTFLFYIFTVTFVGMILHLILDGIYALYAKRLGERTISLIWWLKKFKGRKEVLKKAF